MIPRVLHHIWLGPKAFPDEWAARWRKMHPEWEVKVWREADLGGLEMPNRGAYEDFLARRCWHGASDIARVGVLLAEGGVYVDVDSKPLRPFTDAPFMAAGFFAGYEPVATLPGRIANGTIGSEPRHPILRTYAELVAGMESLDEPWDTCGGTGLTAAVLVHHRCCRPAIQPARVFYARDARGNPTAGREEPYSEHFWATTNRLYPFRVVICVPRRAGDPRRDRTWKFVREHWSSLGWAILEGHHDDGPFNAAAARNTAARLADEAGCGSCTEPWGVAVFVDADTIMLDHEPVRQAVRRANETGKLVRPYRTYRMTDEAQADAIMAGHRPRGHVRGLSSAHTHGGVNVVSRQLFDRVGGYDERFVGWGGEDTAFELACRSLAGFEQLRGEVWHLWHPISDDRNTSHPGFIANVALRRRYEQARRPTVMRALLDERTGAPPAPPQVGLVIITNGRRECIAPTIASLEANAGPFAARLICDDSGDPAYAAWLRETFPAFTVAAHPHLGHGPAVRFAKAEAVKLDVDWVFWSEDDFEFTRPIDLVALARTMEAEGDDLKQMVIRRQAWFPSEVEAGGMIERFDPALFTERDGPAGPWIEHRQFYSLNPHLVRRDFLAAVRWPAVPNSEHHFGRQLFRDQRVRCGIWGPKADEPWARHMGERTGSGY